MSYLKNLIRFLLVFVVLSACGEQKQKEEASTTSSSIKDTIVSKEDKPVNKAEKSVDTTTQFPELTNDNVIEFLTQYGAKNPETKVRVTAFNGEFKDSLDIELYDDTPLHRANFIYLTKQGYFNETFFHRIVPNFIIQGGNSDNVSTPKKRGRIGDYLLPAELDNNRVHRYGTVSGAKEYRENPGKQTAPYEFFIFLGPQSATGHLNGNYTIFGRVTRNMELVEKIANLPHDDGDWPLRNVYITAKVME
ncbi:peptidylprolyl isomerase [Altibacter sp. HG106]|uniref:peptidylprolyl isomerase n=1 Tax=Altibacter sp. HG106 TaxID=3023937 RepID=UPI002350C68F|nr:peptidylprolyl isomerase [Altibacter sp. HG106]MDC7993832.1 peptidylprolyl isomerase [Altibacter sp. HG106]